MKLFDIKNTSAKDAAKAFQKANEKAEVSKEEPPKQKPPPEYKRLGDKGSVNYSLGGKKGKTEDLT